jgi:uncharacterized membrane protein YedE/YeeE
MVPLLLYVGNRSFGISSSLRHICAACFPGKIEYFRYDWRAQSWNLALVAGIALGGLLATHFFLPDKAINLSPATIADLKALGVQDFEHYVPQDLFSWESLISGKGWLLIVVGGFLVGFGTRYANGCTSGHSITGLSNLQLASLVATICFFIGGLLVTHVLYPIIFAT